MTTLGSQVLLIKGKKPPSTNTVWLDGSFPVLLTANLRGEPYSSFTTSFNGMVTAHPDDVVISYDGTVGLSSTGLSGAVGSTLGILKIQDTERLNPNYLCEFLRSKEALIRSNSRGSSIPHLDPVYLKSLHLPMVSAAEQLRIVQSIKTARDLENAISRELLAYSELASSVFANSFNLALLPSKPLLELIDEGDKINYGVVQPGGDSGSGVPLIRVTDIDGGRVNRSKLRFIETEVDNRHRRSRILGTEILVTCVGNIGSIAVTNASDIGSNIARAICRIPITDSFLRTYVAWFLRSPKAQDYFQVEARTVAQATLNVKQLSEVRVPIPSSAEMVSFAEKISKIEAAQKLAGDALVTAHELTSRLQHHFFGGDYE